MRIFKALEPSELSLASPGEEVAVIRYRITGDGGLLSPAGLPRRMPGSVACLAGREVPRRRSFSLLADEMAAECRRRDFRGVYADYPEAPHALLSALCRVLPRAGIAVYANPPCEEGCIRIIAPSPEKPGFEKALSQARSAGFPFAVDLCVARGRYPVPGGRREHISSSVLFSLARSGAGSYCGELLCNWITDPGQGCLMLYDDIKSLTKRIELCEGFGAQAVFVIARELELLRRAAKGEG